MLRLLADENFPAAAVDALGKRGHDINNSSCAKYGARAMPKKAITCRIYMGQLRKKLEADPANPRYLITEPGLGYRFQLEV